MDAALIAKTVELYRAGVKPKLIWEHFQSEGIAVNRHSLRRELSLRGISGKRGANGHHTLTDTQRWSAIRTHLLATSERTGIPITVLVVSDEHVPDHHPQSIAMNAAVARAVQPHVVFFNGDQLDFSLIGRFSKQRRAGKRDILKDVESDWRDYVQQMRAACPKATFVFLGGNHNERLEDWLNEHWEVGETVEEAYVNLVRANGEVLYLDGAHETSLGWWIVHHGVRTGKNAAKNTAEDFKTRPSAHGHTHTFGLHVMTAPLYPHGVRPIFTLNLGLASNNPPQYEIHKKGERPINWIRGCQVWHLLDHERIAMPQPVVYFDCRNGDMVSFVGNKVLRVNAQIDGAQS